MCSVQAKRCALLSVVTKETVSVYPRSV